jgi:hypothetical protein
MALLRRSICPSAFMSTHQRSYPPFTVHITINFSDNCVRGVATTARNRHASQLTPKDIDGRPPAHENHDRQA